MSLELLLFLQPSSSRSLYIMCCFFNPLHHPIKNFPLTFRAKKKDESWGYQNKNISRTNSSISCKFTLLSGILCQTKSLTLSTNVQKPPARLDPSVPRTDAAVKDDEIVHLLDLPGRQNHGQLGGMVGWWHGGMVVLFDVICRFWGYK